MDQLVPFGKYKGQPIEVLAADQDYCKWLVAQDWFRSRFGPIHTIIVNNFTKPDETPEHNALQALFTDEDWRNTFAFHMVDAEKILVDVVTNRLGKVEKTLAYLDENARYFDPALNIKERYLEAISVYRQFIQHGVDQLLFSVDSKAQFEVVGIDVSLRANITYEDPVLSCADAFYTGLKDYLERVRWNSWIKFTPREDVGRVFVDYGRYIIECKPSVSDDYPAILRQMRAHKSALKSSDYRHILLIGLGGYTGVGATFDQVKEIFSSAGIQIVFASDYTSPHER